jgi:hypothetical protein
MKEKIRYIVIIAICAFLSVLLAYLAYAVLGEVFLK